MGWANLYRPHGTRKITISTVITDSTTGKQSIETDHATLQTS